MCAVNVEQGDAHVLETERGGVIVILGHEVEVIVMAVRYQTEDIAINGFRALDVL